VSISKFILELFLNPIIIIIVATFLYFTVSFIIKIFYLKKEIFYVINIFENYKKEDLLYRFEELDEALKQNNFIKNAWEDLKNSLIFDEKTSYKTTDDELYFDSVTENNSNVFLTIDPRFIFNEENLINRFINYKLINSVPSILTGLGPLGTFIYIAIAFCGISFSSDTETIRSISHLISKMQIAAIISIIAISSSILFTIIERLLYYFFCSRPIETLNLVINSLFDKIPAEKFFIELIKQTKTQNMFTSQVIKNMPKEITKSFEETAKTNFIPYFENMIFVLNNIDKNIKLLNAKRNRDEQDIKNIKEIIDINEL
jgi:hypothetical protein